MSKLPIQPLRQTHRPAGRLFRISAHSTPRFRGDLLYGDRQFGWPLAALRVQQELGPVRHALSQLVVAGVMTVFPPWGPPNDGPENIAQVSKERS